MNCRRENAAFMWIIKRIYAKIYSETLRMISFFEMILICKKVYSIDPLGKIAGKIMILAPHSDDEWVGCSQLIKTNNKQVLIVNMDMSGDDSVGIHNLRYAEMELMAKNNGSEIVTLREDKKKHTALSELIESYNPEYIAVPFYYDWHKEHLLTRNILNKALNSLVKKRNELKIIEYQVSVPIPCNEITHCVSMTKREQDEKWRRFSQTYKTQDFFPIWRYKYNERIAGRYNNVYAAECYSVKNVSKWQDLYDDNLISENDRQLIMKSFIRLGKIRMVLQEIESRRIIGDDTEL